MSTKDYKIRTIVLKKTKLSEADLIITFLAEDGSQVRAVAKGARKPSSTFASRLEIFSNVEVLLAKGKNLDIVKEAKIINAYSKIRSDVEKAVCAAPAVELLGKATQRNLESEKLYPVTLNFLNEVEKIKDSYYLKALCTAHLIKVCSFIGFRPSLANCVVCGTDTSTYLQNLNLNINFSYEDGGIVCSRCSKRSETIKLTAATIKLIHDLIHTKFEDVKLMTVAEKYVDEALQFCKKWILYHVGTDMKALSFYMKNI